MAEDKKPQVFLSYASENLDMVRKVYEGLVKRKLNVWFDKEHLKPGRWKPQIERAIRRSRYFIICLSNAAIKKTGDEPGFQDHELNEAYEIARNQPEQEFAIIPVRLEECDRGDHRLTSFQQYDLFEHIDEGLDRLAVNMGGVSLSDPDARDERSENEKLIAGIMAKASAEYYAGRFQQSITLLDSALILSPNHALAIHERGVSFGRLGKDEQALQDFDQALKLKPDFVSAWLNKGIALRGLGRKAEAIKAFDQALKLEPYFTHVWKKKGETLAALGKHEKAIKAFEIALMFMPKDAEAWLNKGIALGQLGKHEEAIDAFDQALGIKPDHAEGRHKNEVLSKLEKALETFNREIGIKTNLAGAWFNKAIALGKLGKHKEAIAAYDEGLRIKPDDVNSWFNKGLILGELKNYDEAVEAFDEALKIKPDLAEAWFNKGAALSNLGTYEEALKAINKALELKPDCIDAQDIRTELTEEIRKKK